MDIEAAKKISVRIREERKFYGLTQEELAKKAGISTMSIRRYETGERMPNRKTLEKIAEAMEMTVGELYFGSIPMRVDQIEKEKHNPLSQEEQSYASQFEPIREGDEKQLDDILVQIGKGMNAGVNPPSVHVLSTLGISPEIALLVYSLSKLSKKELAIIVDDIRKRLEEDGQEESDAQKNNS